MAKRLLPSLNRVLVEKLVQPKKTAGGILLPEQLNAAKQSKLIPVAAAVHWVAIRERERKRAQVRFLRCYSLLW